MTSRAGELRAQGRDVISLSAGEPDFPTPQHVQDAAVAAIRAGHTRYTAVGGLPELTSSWAHVPIAAVIVLAAIGAMGHGILNIDDPAERHRRIGHDREESDRKRAFTRRLEQ